MVRSRVLISVVSVALAVVTLAAADSAPLRKHAKHPHEQNTPGYAASDADIGAMGAQCRAQVAKIWPNGTTTYGRQPMEPLFDACMANGGRIP